MKDYDIANNAKMLDISEVASKVKLTDITKYGNYIAKINSCDSNKKKGRLILVTAITPTPLGEGKTTVSIGLIDALNKLGLNAGGALREPSLGPVFGIKGGATGGGYSQIIPSNDINLHFTGDFHAVTSANNLLASAIDNHIYQGNELEIEKVTFKRCIDINDRSLREKFNITAASEIMTILCLAKDIKDLKRRLGNIIVGYNKNGNNIYAKDLKVEGAMTALLKDAIKPNLVQTLEGNPVIIHGGPFANISLGCNSVIATTTGLRLFDYLVTEAGFGSDLGAEKFLDIKCRNNDLVPDCVVLVATLRALKYHGGFDNLDAHIENLKKFGVNVVVALNKFAADDIEEIEAIRVHCENMNVEFATVDSYQNGGFGSIDLANIVKDKEHRTINYMYDLEDDIKVKIEKLAREIYHASSVTYTEEASKLIEEIRKSNINYPICVAKTQYSISDNAKKLGSPKDYNITVKNIEIMNGAEIIVVYLNNIITMPGLSKNPSYEHIDVDENDNIIGIE